MKNITIRTNKGNVQIRKGLCTSHKAMIHSKKFDLNLVGSFPKYPGKEGGYVDFDVSLTEDRIIAFLNESDSITVNKGKDSETVLQAENDHYSITIFFGDAIKGGEE